MELCLFAKAEKLKMKKLFERGKDIKYDVQILDGRLSAEKRC